MIVPVLIGVLAGCGPKPNLRVPSEDWGGAGYEPIEGDTLTVLEDAELGEDDLGVLVDTLNTPTFEIDVPELPDSVAVATEARLHTADEIFDYPVVINRRVLAYVDQFTGKSRGSFQRSLYRSGRYLPLARAIFAEHGIPQDLAFLAHVESGFRHNALSRARALGLWQFMKGTARDYGLRCDSYVDERMDPIKSTHAAARYLKALYERYDDWYLALAAYNAGPGKVNTAIRRADSRDFWELAKTRYLRAETRNFVPAILAATILAKSPGDFGFTEDAEPPLETDVITVDVATDLRIVAQCAGVPLESIQERNPSLRQLQTPPNEPLYAVHVPVGTAERTELALAEIPRDQRLLFQRHRVRSGDTLGRLARRYGTTVRAIQDANNMGRRTLIHVGRTLLVPASGSTARELASRVSDPSKSSAQPRTEETRYTVRKGDTLVSISQRFGVSVPELQERNRLDNPNALAIDQRLIIPPNASPPPGDEGASVALHVEPEGESDDPATASSDATEAEASFGEAAPSDAVGGGLDAGLDTGLDADPDADPDASPDSDGGPDVTLDTTLDLGRGPSTAHLIEEARTALDAERETAQAASGAAEGEPKPASKPEAARIYRVQKGDSPWGIARRYGVSVEQLRAWNGLRRSEKIYPGQTLNISAPEGAEQAPSKDARLHVVSRGDTLWSIARRYGVSVRDLAAWNGISTRTLIHPGQRIRVF